MHMSLHVNKVYIILQFECRFRLTKDIGDFRLEMVCLFRALFLVLLISDFILLEYKNAFLITFCKITKKKLMKLPRELLVFVIFYLNKVKIYVMATVEQFKFKNENFKKKIRKNRNRVQNPCKQSM